MMPMRTPRYYRLIGKLPVLCRDIDEWADYMASVDCRVAETLVGPLLVSTIFLVLDHNFGRGEPLIFETMIFGDLEDSYQRRYCTWDEAEAGHNFAVAVAEAMVLRRANKLLATTRGEEENR